MYDLQQFIYRFFKPYFSCLNGDTIIFPIDILDISTFLDLICSQANDFWKNREERVAILCSGVEEKNEIIFWPKPLELACFYS